MYSPQVVFQHEIDPDEGLRSRKKAKTRRAIEDAAIELFAQHGYEATTVEQIAELAEVSSTTFFRYFPTKADVVLSEQAEALPLLRRAIVDRPRDEDDLDAVQHALKSAWINVIDAERTARTAHAMATSPTLRGLGYEIGRGWLDVISEALATRHRRRRPDARCVVAARVSLTVFSVSAETWINGGCKGDLGVELDRGFAMFRSVCAPTST